MAQAIVFYISGHGFGHASRSIEVINAILAQRPETRVGVRTSAPRWLFDLTVKGKVSYSTLECDTGVVQIVRYNAVNDFGTVVNPMIVAGQLHGGVAQGIGQALMEEVNYDSSGQPITGSFMDYALPRAEDIPPMGIGDHPSPAKTNPLGTKGCGEAGCAGSLCVIVNAVLDALSEYGIKEVNMPLTPEKVWRALQRK